jgi:hypothetical protein
MSLTYRTIERHAEALCSQQSMLCLIPRWRDHLIATTEKAGHLCSLLPVWT